MFRKKFTLKRIVWLPLSASKALWFKDLLEDKKTADEFDKDFIKDLNEQKRRLESAFFKVCFIQLAIQILLFINIAIKPTDFSILDVAVKDIVAVKEFCLLFCSTGLVFLSSMQAKIFEINAIIKVWIEKECPGVGAEFKVIPYQDLTIGPSYKDHPHKAVFTTFAHSAWLFLFIASFSIYFVALVGGSFFINGYLIYDLYIAPTLTAPWNALVIGYVLIANFLSFLFSFCTYIPLPYADYTRLQELMDLKERDPAAYEKKQQELFAEFRKKHRIK